MSEAERREQNGTRVSRCRTVNVLWTLAKIRSLDLSFNTTSKPYAFPDFLAKNIFQKLMRGIKI